MTTCTWKPRCMLTACSQAFTDRFFESKAASDAPSRARHGRAAHLRFEEVRTAAEQVPLQGLRPVAHMVARWAPQGACAGRPLLPRDVVRLPRHQASGVCALGVDVFMLMGRCICGVNQGASAGPATVTNITWGQRQSQVLR